MLSASFHSGARQGSLTGKGHRSDAAEMMNMATNQVALDHLKFQWAFDLIQVVSNVFNELIQI